MPEKTPTPLFADEKMLFAIGYAIGMVDTTPHVHYEVARAVSEQLYRAQLYLQSHITLEIEEPNNG